MYSVSLLERNMAILSSFYAVLVFKNDPYLLSLQYKLKMTSLSKVYDENKRFRLIFTKTLIFLTKTGMQLLTGAEHFGNVIFRYSELPSQYHIDASIDVNRPRQDSGITCVL